MIREHINEFIPTNDQEVNDKLAFLRFIDYFDDVLTRKNIFGHFTSSAFVVNEDFNKTLVVHHNIFGGFIYPGGHADGEEDLLSVAIREVKEETGIDVTPLNDGNIFSIQVLPNKGHIKRDQYISAHIHFDVLYLLVAKNCDMNKITILASENSRVKWINLEDSYNEQMVDWIRPINKKIVEKIKKLGLSHH